MSTKIETQQSVTPGDMKVCMRIGGILYEIGHLYSYQLTTETEQVPRLVLGEKYAIAGTRGKREHQGTLIFNVINQSVVQELKSILFETGNKVIQNGGFNSTILSGTFTDIDAEEFEENLGNMVTANTNTDDINAMDLPPFDIIITAQDRLIPTRYTQKKIIGVVIYGQSNAIGIDTVTTQDVYPFMCRSVSPLRVFESNSTNLNDAVNESLEESEDGNFISTLVS